MKKVLILIGEPRSGNHLVADLLGQLPQHSLYPEDNPVGVHKNLPKQPSTVIDHIQDCVARCDEGQTIVTFVHLHEIEHYFHGEIMLYWKKYMTDKHYELQFLYIVRNPVACYVSWKQAKADNRWIQHSSETHPEKPRITIDPVELAQWLLNTHRRSHKLLIGWTVDWEDVIDYEDLEEALEQGDPCLAINYALDELEHITPTIKKQDHRPLSQRVTNPEVLRAIGYKEGGLR